MNIIPFDFDSQTVRTVLIDGKPWFLAADLCRVLDYQNGPEAIRCIEREKVRIEAEVSRRLKATRKPTTRPR